MVKKINTFYSKENLDNLLHFIVLGEPKVGKITLANCLLSGTHSIQNGEMPLIKADYKKSEFSQNALDSERSLNDFFMNKPQEIPSSVFSTAAREFNMAISSDYEWLTGHILGSSLNADTAVLVLDASQGFLMRAKRQIYLLSLVGVKRIILVVNKMDLVDFSEQSFNKISQEFRTYVSSFGFECATAIPVSAIFCENVTAFSKLMAWYKGSALIQALENLPILQAVKAKDLPLVLPVHAVGGGDGQPKFYIGKVVRGQAKDSDQIRVIRSGQIASISKACSLTKMAPQEKAFAKKLETFSLVFNADLEIFLGDVLTSAQSPILSSDQFEVILIWLDKDPGLSGRNYDLILSTQQAIASITSIKHRIDFETLKESPCKALSLNDVAQCNIALNKSIAFEKFSDSNELGSFILTDRFSKTVAAFGLILHSLRRADNVHTQALSVTKADREKLQGHQGKVIWFTGLSGSGKSTLANALEIELNSQRKRTYLLDGDNIRQGLNKDLGFTDADRVENIRRISEVARLMMDAGLIVITAFISPFIQERELAKSLIGIENFIEVFVDTPIVVCEQRDPKGLYKKAREGMLPNFSGVSSPYEPPLHPHITINALEIKDIEDAVKKIIELLELALACLRFILVLVIAHFILAFPLWMRLW